MLRCLAITVAIVLVVPGEAAGTVNIWLSKSGTILPGSSFPATPGTLPIFEPTVGTSETVYIWGRPDPGKSLANLSLNLVAETQPVCSPTCAIPNAIAFTSVTIFNQPFGIPSVTRFEYVDDSTSIPPLPITANRIDGIEGLRIFDTGSIPAVGIGSASDPRYDSLHNSWLIAEVSYNVLVTGGGSETRLFFEIGPIGMNHAGEETIDAFVVFGHATDVVLNGHDDRGIHPSIFDALIRPRRLPGDANGNGVVESADYTIWRTNFGSTTLLSADHNANGIVDSADYSIWRDHLGLSVGAGGALAIAEPAAAGLVSIALLALLAFRRPSFARANS